MRHPAHRIDERIHVLRRRVTPRPSHDAASTAELTDQRETSDGFVPRARRPAATVAVSGTRIVHDDYPACGRRSRKSSLLGHRRLLWQGITLQQIGALRGHSLALSASLYACSPVERAGRMPRQ
jgi:hypothetical protein